MNWLVLLILVGIGLWSIYSSRRKAEEVLLDLRDEDSALEKRQGRDLELEKLGIVDKGQQKRFRFILKFLPIGLPIFLVLFRALFGFESFEGALILAVLGFAVGVLARGRLLEHAGRKFKERIEFYLPLAMERIVMSVEAGLDLVPALKGLVELEERVGDKRDPTTFLFRKVVDLTESGVRFDQSLDEVSSQVEGTSLRHAFVHLGLAYKEGGEIITPLRELSDSAQLQFQENIEERIAKLPVKATMPLLVMFLGLMICFLTPPAIQIVGVAREANQGISGAGSFK
jgi:pilus assembly protein TadC